MYLKLLPRLLFAILVFSACQKAPLITENERIPEKQLIREAEAKINLAQAEAMKIRQLVTLRMPSNAVTLPAGSVDGLAAAIAAAGTGGTVLVETGEHYESRSVVVDRRVNIIGEPGSILISGAQPLLEAGKVDPALYLKDASGILIHGLDIRAETNQGGTGIYMEQADKAYISDNRLIDFEFSIVNQHSNHSYITRNTIVGTSAWQTNPTIEVYGIINMNGDRVRIFNNHITNTVFGIWACDEDGLMSGNTTNGNYIGIILCKVPTAIPLPDGSIGGSENSGTNWITQHNTANSNFHVGIIVIDGANNNLLVMNKATGNTDADVELAGDSERFGFLVPTSFDNKLISANGINIKDCGVNNSVHGGDIIDTALNPCY